MEWSDYQEAIFDEVADEDGGDLIVQARAGSGKTATIIEALSYVPRRESVLLVAFNKTIEEELARRAPEGVEVRTFHGYGLRTLTKAIGDLKVDPNRPRQLCHQLFGGKLHRETVTAHSHILAACKHQNLFDPTDTQIDDLMYRFDIEPNVPFPADKMPKATVRQITDWQVQERKEFVKRTKRLLNESKNVKGFIDFNDMIWLPNALDIKPFRYDRVFVDEAQDTDPGQVDLVERGLGNSGRLSYVGDDRQAIYQWRGADLNALQLDDANELPLPVCYRCARSIVRVARQIVPDIEPWSESPEGKVVRISSDDIVKYPEPGDVILSRTNGALVGVWLKLISAGLPAKILGRDIGRGLASFIKQSKASTILELLDYTEKWLEVEIRKLQKQDRSITGALDKVACVKYLTRGLDSVDDVIDRAEEIFTQNIKDERITLSTVHKYKGMENRRVFVLMKTFRWRSHREEANIFYVAVTRAKEELYLVGSEDDHRRCVYGIPPKRFSHPTLEVDWEFE